MNPPWTPYGVWKAPVCETDRWSDHLPVHLLSKLVLLIFTQFSLRWTGLLCIRVFKQEMLFRTRKTSQKMSAVRTCRDRKSWHSWEKSSMDRRNDVRAMIKDVERGQQWTVIFLVSLALQPQVSRRLRAIFSRPLTLP